MLPVQVTKYMKLIVDDLLKNLTNNQWRIRESRYCQFSSVHSCWEISFGRALSKADDLFIIDTVRIVHMANKVKTNIEKITSHVITRKR